MGAVAHGGQPCAAYYAGAADAHGCAVRGYRHGGVAGHASLCCSWVYGHGGVAAGQHAFRAWRGLFVVYRARHGCGRAGSLPPRVGTGSFGGAGVGRSLYRADAFACTDRTDTHAGGSRYPRYGSHLFLYSVYAHAVPCRVGHFRRRVAWSGGYQNPHARGYYRQYRQRAAQFSAHLPHENACAILGA